MKKKIHVAISFFLVIYLSPNSYSQEWIKTFSSSAWNMFSYQVIEDYDKGVLIGGNQSLTSPMKIGWVIKTDINGNVLWDKKLGDGIRQWALDGVDRTADGGIIVAGVCDSLDTQWKDPFILKLTECGEVAWCHVFHTDNDRDYGIKIKALPDNTYILLLKDWDVNPSQSVWLMHLDEYGEILWEQRYFQNDPMVRPYNITDLKITPEGNYLVTGTCYRPISGQTQPDWVWPMMIMADSTGEAIWEIPWGYSLPFTEQVMGEGFHSILTDQAVYSCISHYFYPTIHTVPCLIKTSLTGDPISYQDLKPNTDFGKASTITKLSDSVFFIGTGYVYGTSNTMSVLKTDTLGNVIKETILNHSEFIPIDATLTQDQKLLITAWDFNSTSNKYLFHLWKLNQNLDFDSIYTVPRVYDSLCPYPIVSSTLSLPPCGLTVGVEEPLVDEELVRMMVYPNPCSDIVHIRLPERVRLESQTKSFTVQTTFHQWTKDLDLEVFDLFARPVSRQTVKPGTKEASFDVSGWIKGMYLVRLSSEGNVIATDKIIVN
jgi:hypothetical protein